MDTNVLVSGLISIQSPPRYLINGWLGGRFILVTSLYQVQEVNHVLAYPRIAGRIQLEAQEVEMVLAGLLAEAEIVPGHLQLPGVTRDPKDDAIVACAREGGADYIVSGDQDLLVLGEYEGIQVVTPRWFLESLEPE